MDPEITFKCTNSQCKSFEVVIPIHRYCLIGATGTAGDEEYWIARSKHCRKCYCIGELIIQHGGRTFNDLEVFEQYISGLAKEHRLLKKLKDRGVAEASEIIQFKDLRQLLSDVKCPCCAQPFIDSK